MLHQPIAVLVKRRGSGTLFLKFHVQETDEITDCSSIARKVGARFEQNSVQ